MSGWLRRRWIGLTCNWLVIGFTCWRRGHQWRTMRVQAVELTDCGWCGKFRGYRRMDDEAARRAIRRAVLAAGWTVT